MVKIIQLLLQQPNEEQLEDQKKTELVHLIIIVFDQFLGAIL